MSPAKSSKPLIPYLRQSRARERTISLADQRRAIETWAKTNGAKLAPEVVEQGVSGNKSWRVRELGRAVEACEEGRAAGVIVFDQDRLTREDYLGTAEVWTALQKAKARLVDASMGGDVPRTAFVFKAEFARQQWERHQLNWSNARRAAIERGVHIGPSPAGYTKGEDGRLVANEYAPAIREAFLLRAHGASWTQVAQHLTDANVPTSRGNTRWSLKAAEKLTRNETYLGRVRSGAFVQEGTHEALIDRATWERVQANREVRATTRNGHEASLLSGILRCGTCGHRLTRDDVRRGDKSYGYYRCRNAGACEARAGISAMKIEPLLIAAALERLEARKVEIAETDAPDADTLQAELEDAEAEVAAYLQHVSARTPGFADGLAAREAVVEEKRQALASIPQGDSLILDVQDADVFEMFFEFNREGQRAILGDLIERAILAPGKSDVQERIAVAWR